MLTIKLLGDLSKLHTDRINTFVTIYSVSTCGCYWSLYQRICLGGLGWSSRTVRANIFSTAVLIDIENNQIPTGRRLTSCFLQSLKELNSGPQKTNSSSDREED